MTTTLELDPSRPYQTRGELLAVWRPRGRGREALSEGLVATVDICRNPACPCTDAQVQAVRIDDRAALATREGSRLRISWRDQKGGPPQPEGSFQVKIDIVTGAVRSPDGADPAPAVAQYLGEPLPFWVLDHLWDLWCAPRPPLRVDWREQALQLWEPGDLLSAIIAYPEWRPDRYMVGDAVYQIDTLFCANPSCDCTESRLVVFRVCDDGGRLEEAGTARLPPETMIPVEFESYGLDRQTFTRLYFDWTRRHVPPEARLRELRDLVRQRGRELYDIAAARLRSARAATPIASAGLLTRGNPSLSPARIGTAITVPQTSPPPIRKAPCPCGSGKKYKHCCGMLP